MNNVNRGEEKLLDSEPGRPMQPERMSDEFVGRDPTRGTISRIVRTLDMMPVFFGKGLDDFTNSVEFEHREFLFWVEPPENNSRVCPTEYTSNVNF
jgi:hypothetical protein